jgi:nucleoside-diphosphate-sugar epimerase
LLTGLAAGVPIALSDGRQRRDYVHVVDAARWLLQIADRSRQTMPTASSSIVNLGTGHSVLLKDVAHWVAAALCADPGLLHFGARHRSAADQDDLLADVDLLVSLVGRAPPQRLNRNLNVSLFV